MNTITVQTGASGYTVTAPVNFDCLDHDFFTVLGCAQHEYRHVVGFCCISCGDMADLSASFDLCGPENPFPEQAPWDKEI